MRGRSRHGGWSRTRINEAVMWRELLAQPPTEIAAALTEDSARGQLLRETCPVFGKGLTSRDVAELIVHPDVAPP
jgi:hypothetical protein